METKQNEKQRYISPEIKAEVIVLEQGIAAGSANVNPQDSNGDVKDTWTTDADNNQTVKW
ncbi:MAG: hypothetical protein LBJ04_16235 [Sphingobacterium sp.]|jgi:hypothetical protein|nr:hypothetical protein [Sphingobacterium sp.]